MDERVAGGDCGDPKDCSLGGDANDIIASFKDDADVDGRGDSDGIVCNDDGSGNDFVFLINGSSRGCESVIASKFDEDSGK